MDAHDEMIASNKGDMPTYEELEQQLAAEREAREKAESKASDLMLAITAAQAFSETELGIIGQVSSPAWRQQLRRIKQRAEAAEARIKASQEQEPIYEVVICGAWAEVKNRFDYDVRAENERRIRYKQPIIPPEVAELQRELDERAKLLLEAVNEGCRLTTENAELTRKLAGNEVLLLGAISELGAMKGKSEDEILAECRKNYPSASSKLLSEARKVPEGWKLVPVEPTSGMIQAGRMQFYHTPDAHWKAMLNASPEYKERT